MLFHIFYWRIVCAASKALCGCHDLLGVPNRKHRAAAHTHMDGYLTSLLMASTQNNVWTHLAATFQVFQFTSFFLPLFGVCVFFFYFFILVVFARVRLSNDTMSLACTRYILILLGLTFKHIARKFINAYVKGASHAPLYTLSTSSRR